MKPSATNIQTVNAICCNGSNQQEPAAGSTGGACVPVRAALVYCIRALLLTLSFVAAESVSWPAPTALPFVHPRMQ